MSDGKPLAKRPTTRVMTRRIQKEWASNNLSGPSSYSHRLILIVNN